MQRLSSNKRLRSLGGSAALRNAPLDRPGPANVQFKSGWIDDRQPGLLPLPPQPWLPAPYDNRDIFAMRAVATGTASAEQQKRAIEWLVFASGYYDIAYVPGEPHDTSFAAGKRWIGNQVVKLINMRVPESKEGA